MKISVIGIGFVGLSISILLSKKHDVTAFDIDENKIKKINNNKSPIDDSDIELYLKNQKLSFKATTEATLAYNHAEYIVIAVPTDYDSLDNRFNTDIVEKVICDISKINYNAIVIIKSTIPIGFTDYLTEKYSNLTIFFSPEFLREGKALYDNLYPLRIIIGGFSQKAKVFANILHECSNNKETPIMFMSSKEAEAVKLFSNTYLAMRVSFFNELDTFCEVNNLSSKDIINGVCSDSRIGNYYNNPSFGYGGYCLPKDTKQLVSNFKNVPNELIKSVVQANIIRKEFIAKKIINSHIKTLGVYRLTMKTNSSNFKESAILDVINIISKKNINIIIYEPLIEANSFQGYKCYKKLDEFICNSELIIANRMTNEIRAAGKKIYSRDIFMNN